MVNYNNGKIYKIEPICDHDEGDIYIGSTTKKYLSQRIDNHRSKYKQWKNNEFHKVQVFEIFDKYGVSNCQIETVNVDSKDELLAREKHYIKSVKCVNKCTPGQTQKEYYENNKEEIKFKKKEYRENNKETIKLKDKEYKNNHKEEIKLYVKKYREENIEKLQKKSVCPCGGCYTHYHQSHHIKTIKRQNYLKSQTDV